MRSRWVVRNGVVGRRVLLRVAGALVASMAGLADVSAGPLDAAESTGELMIVTDPQVSSASLEAALADVGLPAPQRIAGLPARYSWRLVSVPAADAETRALLRSIPGVEGVRPIYRVEGMEDPILSSGQVLARFHPGTPRGQAEAVAAAYGAWVVRPIIGLDQAYVLGVDESLQTAAQCAAAIAGDASVRFCHPNLLIKLQRHQAGPILDPNYQWQWHLRNTGQLPGGLAGADVDAEGAWDVTLGSGAVVAVIDDSLQRDHEDLAANYLTGYDFLDSDNDPSPSQGPASGCFFDEDEEEWFCSMDPIGEAHGTAVAGLIAAAPNNIGVRGVAPEAQLIGCKIGLGWFYVSDLDIAEAFLFAEQNGAMVINNSWGGPGMAIYPVIPSTEIWLPDVISEAIEEVSTHGRDGRGVLVLFSSGNSSIPISYDNVYAALPNVMAVGATLRDDTLSCYSSFGPEQSVVAPGGGLAEPTMLLNSYYWWDWEDRCFEEDIATTDNMEVPSPDDGWPIRGYNPAKKLLDVLEGMYCPPAYEVCLPLVSDNYALEDLPNFNYTRRFSGTSAACPVASGVAALVFSVDPSLRAEEARNIIEHTADKPGYVNEVFDAVTGHNERYGHGRVNARRAVEAALAGTSWPSPVRDIENVGTGGVSRFLWTNPANDVADILVVRAPLGKLKWAPADGVRYNVGQQVATGTVIVSTGLTELYEETVDEPSQYDYGIFVRNLQNRYSWGRRVSFTSEGVAPPPLASLSASVTSGTAPLDVHFAAGVVDEAGLKNLAFTWYLGDGTVGTGSTFDHTYFHPGLYNVTLVVTNVEGEQTDTVARITVQAPAADPPTAQIVATPTIGPLPLTVLFRAVVTPGEGNVVSYVWEFGDGATATGDIVEHTYTAAGTYGVKLTVTDDLGAEGTASAVIYPGTTETATDTDTSTDGTAPFCGCGAGCPLAAVGVLLGLLAFACLRWRE